MRLEILVPRRFSTQSRAESGVLIRDLQSENINQDKPLHDQGFRHNAHAKNALTNDSEAGF